MSKPRPVQPYYFWANLILLDSPFEGPVAVVGLIIIYPQEVKIKINLIMPECHGGVRELPGQKKHMFIRCAMAEAICKT